MKYLFLEVKNRGQKQRYEIRHLVKKELRFKKEIDVFGGGEPLPPFKQSSAFDPIRDPSDKGQHFCVSTDGCRLYIVEGKALN